MSASASRPLATRAIHDAAGNLVAAIEVTAVEPGLAAQLEAFRSVRDNVTDLAAVGHGIAETCGQIIGSVRGQLAHLAPDDLELTFGVKIAGEAGIPLITKASGEATIEVKATWRKLPVATAPEGAATQ